jgi:hypothetical protein
MIVVERRGRIVGEWFRNPFMVSSLQPRLKGAEKTYKIFFDCFCVLLWHFF